MFDFKLKVPTDNLNLYEAETQEVEQIQNWVDHTCVSKRSLQRFLTTLTPAQLAQAEVIVDDDSYVVFYPILVGSNATYGPHFDLDDGPQLWDAEDVQTSNPLELIL